MALNDVIFEVTTGGLKKEAAGTDHISALVFDIAAPAAYSGKKVKSYNNLDAVVADGILKGDATYAEVYYHASEFFRLAPGATLELAFSLSDLLDLKQVENGEIKQIGVFGTASIVKSTYQAKADAFDTAHAPVVIVQGVTGALGSADMSTMLAHSVAAVVVGDGSGEGKILADALSQPYIPAVGTVLGLLAKSQVHEHIGHVEQFNLSDGKEFETIILHDGTEATDAKIDVLNTKQFVTFRKHVGIPGTYVTDTPTAIVSTNDYSTIENNRVINKAKREIRKVLVPHLNAALTVSEDGLISVGTVSFFESETSGPLTIMQRKGEISAYDVFIDPSQNVLSTGMLEIEVEIVPRGYARSIRVKIGYTLKVN